MIAFPQCLDQASDPITQDGEQDAVTTTVEMPMIQ